MYPFDQNNQQTYQQYAQANDSGDYSGIDPNEAAGHVQQFMQNAPPEMQQQVYQQHFEQMPMDQRQQFMQQMPPQYQQQMDPNNPQMMAQGFQQIGQQQPGMLQSLLGSGGGLGGMLGGGGASGGGLGGMLGGGGGLGGVMAGGAAAGLAGTIASHLLGSLGR